MVVWADLDPTRGREQAGRRPALLVASDLYLELADTLAIIVPATTVDRGWPNHVPLRGPSLTLPQPTFAMTEQPRTVTRDRLVGVVGVVDSATMGEVDRWLRDFLALP
jgi:mRNA interferase MazF